MQHPVGDMPGRQFLAMRFSDMTIHAWDLARAIDGDERLDPELCETVFAALSPMAPFMAQSGFFGTGQSDEVGDDRPIQARVLDLAGRRP